MLKATQLENDRGRTGTRQPQLGTLLLIRGLYSDRCPESGHPPTPTPGGVSNLAAHHIPQEALRVSIWSKSLGWHRVAGGS